MGALRLQPRDHAPGHAVLARGQCGAMNACFRPQLRTGVVTLRAIRRQVVIRPRKEFLRDPAQGAGAGGINAGARALAGPGRHWQSLAGTGGRWRRVWLCPGATDANEAIRACGTDQSGPVIPPCPDPAHAG